jgi:predicted ATPase
VTFLLTDVERSSAKWDEQAAEMAVALTQHDAVVREAVAGRGGVVFSTAGDGFAAAFDTAHAAATTAIEIQRELATAGSLLRVRMGLNTGETDERDGDYFGPTLNRAGRLRDIAHGGQVLCSDLTSRLLSEGLQQVELVDLGEHRLRDLSRPEHVWQLGRAATFPPLRSGSNLPGNLPTQATEFVGRVAELRGVAEAVEAARVVTLTGAGGAGKTRLALQFAAEAQPGFRHGVWLCDLAPLTSPDGVGPLVADVVGVEAGAKGGWIGAIADRLPNRHMLLVLDNCEHVLDGAAALVDAITRGCPEVVVLATSREGLGVAGERIIAVGSLSLPRPDDLPEIARATDAVSLFLARAGDVRALSSDDQTIAKIAQVCRRLDGIPLAIELAAARTRSLSVTEISDHLDDRFRLLTRGSRTALGRHQTLRAAIDWSFDLLSEPEQHLLARASVFAGGFTLQAAAAVCDPDAISAIDTLDHVDALVRRSMLIAEEDATTTRYRMLETIRQYAEQRLELTGDTVATSRAHLGWCAAFARGAGEQVRSANDSAAIARFEHELDNVRVALQFAVATGDFDGATALLASVPIGALWDSRLGAAMAALAREIAPSLHEHDHPVSAALLSLLSLDAAVRLAGDEAVDLALRACVIARRHNDWLRTGPWLALLLSNLIAGRPETVTITAQEALTRAITENDVYAAAEWHAHLGIANWVTGDVDDAQRLTEIGLTLAEKIGADNLIMRTAFLRGVTLLKPGSDHALALQHFQRAVRLGERVGGNALYGGAAWAILLSNCGADNMNEAELAHELATNLPTPMFLVDANGTLVFFNDAAASIFGKSFDQVGQIPAVEWATIFTPQEQGLRIPIQELPLSIAVLQRKPAHGSIWIRKLDGVRMQLTVTAIPLQDQRGEHLGAAAIFWEAD